MEPVLLDVPDWRAADPRRPLQSARPDRPGRRLADAPLARAQVMSEFALETAGLRKSFGALKVTDDVTLRLPTGARTALIGPNGAGKTTLVGLLSGTLLPDSGRIDLIGHDITAET